MAPVFDVCIRGAGIVGRTLALLLARDRLRVALVDGPRAPGASGAGSDVRAYAINTASRELLESVRGWPDAQHATAVAAMRIASEEGGQVRFDAAGQGVPALAWIVDVAALEARLDEALRYQPLVERVAAPQAAALTAVCEGRASATRAEFGVAFDVTHYPQRAIAARLHCEKPHEGTAFQWFANGEILAFLPLQGNSAALVWSVREEREAGLLALEPAAFATQLEEASGHVLGRIELVSERASWALQLAFASRWCGPGWVLAGDAAHAVHPLAGQGLNLGLADVGALARALQGRDYWRSVADARVLRRYERARKADVLAMGAATDALQQLFAREEAPWALLRNWGMKGFEHSGVLKHWVARQAMGLP